MASIIVSIVYFSLTLVLTIRPSKVVDIVGKILTPLLILSLVVLIIVGIISPIGDISNEVLVNNYIYITIYFKFKKEYN